MTLLSTTKKTYRGTELDTLIGSDGVIFPLNELFSDLAPKLIFVTNYNVVKYSVIEALLQNADWREKTEKGDNDHTYDIRKDYITLHHSKQHTVTIASFEVKNHQKFKSFAQAKNLEDCDNEFKYTATMDGKRLALNHMSKRTNEFTQLYYFRAVFPRPTAAEALILEEARALSGGFMACREVGEFTNVHSYDRRSAYTGQLLKSRIPYGKPKHYSGSHNIPQRRWTVYQILISWVEPIVYDFFDIQKLWLSNGGGEFTLSMPQELYLVLERYYRIKCKVVHTLSYKTREQPFGEFPDIAFNNEYEEIRKRDKARLNLFYGNLGRKQRYTECTYRLDKDKLICAFKGQAELNKNACDFLPLYLYISIGAKVDFVNEISKHWDDIIYCNTDGFISQKVINLELFNARFKDGRGAFQHRGYYKKLALKGVSNYYLSDGTTDDKYIRSGTTPVAPVSYKSFVSGEWVSTVSLTEYGFTKHETRRAETLEEAKKQFEAQKNEWQHFIQRAFAVKGRLIILTEPVIIDDYPTELEEAPEDVAPPLPEGVINHGGKLVLACGGARPCYFRVCKKFSLGGVVYQRGAVVAFKLSENNIDEYIFMVQEKYIEIIRKIETKY